jgi:hypothetical protein
MSEKPVLADFYEKLYFHEVDARDKLYARLQTPLAMLLALGGAFSFLLQNVDRSLTGAVPFAFWVIWAAGLLFVGLSGHNLIRAAWGHEYAFLPLTAKWDAYRVDCEKTYEEFEDSKVLVKSALEAAICAEHIKCATINAGINDSRSYKLHLTIRHLISAACLVLVAFGIFLFGNLDKNLQPSQKTRIGTEVLHKKGSPMAENKPAPPPPPPPPPTRFVRDDRPPSTPAPVKPNVK